MSDKSKVKKTRRGPRAVNRPVAETHADEVVAGGPDAGTLLHTLAKTVCDRLGVACGCHMHLKDNLCIASKTPCPYAPEGGPVVAPAKVPPAKK